MTAENNPIDPTNPAPDSTPAVPPPKRKKRALILKIAAVLVVLVVLLIILAPTLISSGPVVSIVLSQVNKQLTGKVAIGSLSLGWTTGVDVKGIRVLDATSTQIAGIDHVSVPLPLWKAATGNYTLGNVIVDGVTFDAQVDANGISNFQKLVKSSQSTPSTAAPITAESKPSKLPNVSADIKLTNCHGTVTQPGKPIVYLTKLEAEVKIPDINQPITDTLNAVVKVGEQPEGQISLAGTAAAIKGNLVAIDSADVHQILDVTNLSLSAGKPFMPANLLDTLDGLLGAHFAIDLTAGKSAVVDASVIAKQKIAVGGTALGGDTYSTNVFTFAIPKLSAEFPDNLTKWQTGRIKVGADAGSSPILLKIDQGQFTMTADAGISALLNVIANQKPGSAGNLAIVDKFDLAAFAKQLPHLVKIAPGVTVTSGNLTQNIKADWTADESKLTGTTDIADVRGQRGAEPINLAPIHVSIDAAAAGGADVSNMKLVVQSKFATADFQGKTLAALTGKLHTDLAVLKSEVGQLVDLSGTDLAGTLDADLAESGQLTAAPYQSRLTLNLQGQGLKVGKQLDLPVLQVALGADLHGSDKAIFNSVQNLVLTVKTGDGQAAPEDVLTASGNASFNLAGTSVLDYITSAHLQVEVPSVKRAMAVADAVDGKNAYRDTGFQPVRVTTDFRKIRLSRFERTPHRPEARVTTVLASEKTPAPIAAAKSTDAAAKPAIVWENGSLSMTADVSRDPKGIKSVASINGRDLAFHCGEIAYQFKPIALKLGTLLGAAPNAYNVISINELQVTDLTGDLGIATLSMPKPIIVTDLLSLTGPQANGGVKVVGNLTDLSLLLASMQGQKPAAYPYRGEYTLTENIGSKSNTIALQGGIDVAKFQVLNGNAVSFSEDLVSLANDIAYVTSGDDAAVNVNTLSASMKSSGALNLSLTGGSVQKLNTDRVIQLQPKLDYDLAKLWPIIQPMMGDSYKTLKITGHYQKQFNVTGSYPANQPSTEAIKTLNADGDLAVESFDYNGLNLKNLVVPFLLNNGRLITVYTGKPAGQNQAPAAVANETGTLDLGGLLVDLTQAPPRLTVPANKPIIAKLTINPLLAGTYLKNIINNPMFTGDETATGLVDLTIVDCGELPMGNLVTLSDPTNKGKMDLLVSFTKLNISVGNAALAKALGNGSFQADVKNGTVSIAKGVATEHINFVTGTYTLSFDGSVRLKDQAFIPMTMGFPARTIVMKTHLVRDAKVAALIAEPFPIPVEGTVNSPVFRVDKLAGAVADATKKAVIGNLLGGNKKDKNDQGGGNSGGLGGLLNKLEKKK